MSTSRVVAHYSRGNVLESITAALSAAGKSPETVSSADLDAVDQFHLGGRATATRLLSMLDLKPEHAVLDVGCGLGGPARCCAAEFATEGRVTGVDLTPEYVDAGNAMSSWVGATSRVSLLTGDALELGSLVEPASFDAGYMLHVGMNIGDKRALAAATFGALRPGGSFGLFDMMRGDVGALAFPLPFATTAADAAVATPDEYRAAYADAGFELVKEELMGPACASMMEGAIARAKAHAQEHGGPPPLGLQHVMGPSLPQKMANGLGCFKDGSMTAWMMVFKKPES